MADGTDARELERPAGTGAAGGTLVITAGLISLATLDDHGTTISMIARQVLAAIGMAMFQVQNNSALMGAAPRDMRGAAAGTLATGRVIGQPCRSRSRPRVTSV